MGIIVPSPIAVEIVHFKVKAGTNEQEFLKASAGMVQELSKLPGFLDRELLKGENGQWTDIVHWETMEHALKATDDVMRLPLCLAYFGHIDDTTLQMMHFTLSQRYP
jgi:quinol monooxygenase YgiN